MLGNEHVEFLRLYDTQTDLFLRLNAQIAIKFCDSLGCCIPVSEDELGSPPAPTILGMRSKDQ
jgi:hypothetical protein